MIEGETMYWRWSSVTTFGMLIAGATFGWLAASGHVSWQGIMSLQDSAKTVQSPIAFQPAQLDCCSGTLTKGDLLALAHHNARVEMKSQQESDKAILEYTTVGNPPAIVRVDHPPHRCGTRICLRCPPKEFRQTGR